MELTKLTQEIKEEETARFEYRGEVAIRETTKEPCFSGCMDMLTTSRIELGFNPKYTEESKPLEKIVANPFKEAFSAVQRHELNHKGGGKFRGCPRNIDLHAENILEPVSKTLRELEFPNIIVNEHQGLYEYMANLVEDVIDNAELGVKGDHVGMALCYKDDASHRREKDDLTFPPLFSAFVQLQQILYGGQRSRRLLEEHYSGEEKVQEAMNNFMQRSGLSDFQKTVTVKTRKRTETGERIKEDKQVFDRKIAVQYCLNERNWPELSRILTEEFAKLIDKDKLSQPEYVKATFVPLKGEADTFSGEMDNKETRMKFVWRKYQRGKDASEGFQPPAYLDNFEALDLVYQRLARNLEIKTRASTRTTTMPVMRYGRRDFDPQKDKLSKARVGFGKKGRLELTVKPYHEDCPIEYTERKRSLPEVKFIMLDTSGSMSWPVEGDEEGIIMNPWADENRQWGDNSRYHHALVAWYGLQELLRKQGSLKHTSVKLANYSGSTKTAANLREAKKLALTPQFGGTSLSMDAIKDMFGREQLVFSLSDGDVTNWGDIKDEYIRRAKQNHYFHLQIGQQTQMSLDLEEAGLSVHYDNCKNLGKLVIDLTRPYITKTQQK